MRKVCPGAMVIGFLKQIFTFLQSYLPHAEIYQTPRKLNSILNRLGFFKKWDHPNRKEIFCKSNFPNIIRIQVVLGAKIKNPRKAVDVLMAQLFRRKQNVPICFTERNVAVSGPWTHTHKPSALYEQENRKERFPTYSWIMRFDGNSPLPGHRIFLWPIPIFTKSCNTINNYLHNAD